MHCMLGYAVHAGALLTPLLASAGGACNLFAEHAARMLRVHDAIFFRGDVSDQLQVRSNCLPQRLLR